MPYASKQNLIDRFGESELIELTDRSNLGVIDDAVLNQAITDADDLIDSYLQGRYSLPLNVVPSSLQRIACDIARYFLYDESASDQVGKRYDDAVKFMKSVSRGELSLGLDSNDQAAPETVGAPEYNASDRVFTSDTLRDF